LSFSEDSPLGEDPPFPEEEKHWLDKDTYHAPKKPLTVGEIEDLHGIVPSFIRQSRVWGHFQQAQEKALPFGISLLDRALFGLLPTDLMLIGAGSGVGKSAAAIEIAGNVSQMGKRVLFLALEAEPEEVEMRLLYQLYAEWYFEDRDRDRSVVFDYRNFRFNRLSLATHKYRDAVFEQFTRNTQFLSTFYKTEKGFTIQDLEAKLRHAANHGYDLVVIDHLHYFDLYGAGRDQHQAMGKLMQQIRDLNLHYQIPIILVAHLRKDFHGFLPTLSDFHGSSDIGKQATLAVMISKVKDGYNPAKGTSKTAFTIPKSRTGAMPLAGIVEFAVRWNRYSPHYRLAYIQEKSESFKELTREELPYWAKDHSDSKNGEPQRS
jgi:replicative DNA helicase